MSSVQLEGDALDAPPRLRPDAGRALLGLTVLGLVIAGSFALTSPVATLQEIAARVRAADPMPVVIAVVAEAGSFAGYILLTWLVVGRGAPRIGLAVSTQITLAGAAITRLLPTAGLGGVGLTLWALRRAGRSSAEATNTLLSFLVVTYAVFVAALVGAGLAVLAGAVDQAPPWLGAGPVAFGVAAVGLTVGVVVRDPGRRRTQAPQPRRQRLARGAEALRSGVLDATGLVRAHDPRLLGALAWWGLDAVVLALAFRALGDTPTVGIVAIGYFAGIIANTVPVPGAVAGGMTGVLLLAGVPLGLALPAVLLYRAISLWLPAPAGLIALLALRRNVHRWSQEDQPEITVDPTRALPRRRGAPSELRPRLLHSTADGHTR